MPERIAFIGGGNMASAILGGLIQQGVSPGQIDVIEPAEPAREQLRSKFGLAPKGDAGPFLDQAALVIWAVKPQVFKQATVAVAPYTGQALHLSVAAGIPSASIAHWLGSERVVRSMPNTPALIGQGITGLFARTGVTQADRSRVEEVLATTGEFVWFDREDLLDAVTALSGSGPAYVFYFLEAMTEAGRQMGLTPEQAYRLALQTFRGASALAQSSGEPPQILRQRVTSKGGTTDAAISMMDGQQLKGMFIQALHAAYQRAGQLGKEFGQK
ncbi:MAG: pyrroline-5-carboxylate reductase [Hylemonella sp.]